MKIYLVLIIMAASVVSAQTENLVNLSGVLNFDNSPELIKQNPANKLPAQINGTKKSPLLAGVLSFIVPGAGEIYNEDYLKSAVFIAVETAAITLGLIYDNKGDDQTEFFENYAETNWSPAKYANWTLDNLSRLNGSLDPNDYDVFEDENRSVVNWNELNRLEEKIGVWYSHKLAPYGDQQYYEMIGKYKQFNPGWNDFVYETPYDYNDPATGNFLHYSSLRGDANDFYKVAKTAVNIIVINHLLSAVDAAWSASRYNNRIDMDVSMKSRRIGYVKEYYPELNIKYIF